MSFKSIKKRETLPERVFNTIKESILNGELKAGSPLPTEPEMEEQFGVSRAVIRDAVRILKGQGLIEIKHGKGMFVTKSQTEAFTDALLTSLRRDNATAWDVEQFEQIFLPQIFSIAAKDATEEDILDIKKSALNYLNLYEKSLYNENETTVEESGNAFKLFMRSIMKSTHNRLIILLGDVLINLRKFRDITIENNEKADIDKILKIETTFIQKYVDVIINRDPIKASETIRTIITLENKIITILKETPVGTSPKIPGKMFFDTYFKKES